MQCSLCVRLENTVDHMDDSIAGRVVHINDVSHGQDTGQSHLAGEGRHGDSLPGARHQRGRPGGEICGVESSSGDVPQ